MTHAHELGILHSLTSPDADPKHWKQSIRDPSLAVRACFWQMIIEDLKLDRGACDLHEAPVK